MESDRRTANVHERLEEHGARVLSDEELLSIVLGAARVRGGRVTATRLLAERSLPEIAWAPAHELEQVSGVGPAGAAAVVAAFELGRRGAWAPPRRGEHVLEPARVYELLRHVAHAEREEFHTVLLDVRGRLIKTAKVAEGSLTQCPVNPRDVLREPLRVAAHGLILAHNHPSGAIDPSSQDAELTDRLRAAAELVGVLVRDHVILSASGYYSFVEAGRWR